MSKKAANLAKLMKKRAKKGHDMKSWDTKDAIDKIGQSAVPKSMVQESGKGMTIKELFKRYDVDNSGGLDQEELKQVMKDLEAMPSVSLRKRLRTRSENTSSWQTRTVTALSAGRSLPFSTGTCRK